MNVALFSDSYTPTKSGIVTVVTQLKSILEQMGHNVCVVTVGSKEERHSEEYEKEDDVFRVTSIPSPVGEDQFIGIPLRSEVIQFIREHNVDIIHSHTEFFMGHMALVVGRELNIPVIASTHTMWEDYYRYYLWMGRLIPRKVIRKIVQRIYKNFYAFINVSQKAHNYFNRSFMLPMIPSAIIPNAIDSNKFIAHTCSEDELDQLRGRLGIKKDDRVILYVGRIVEEKRLDELLEIMIRVVQKRDNAKMVFVGAGERLEKLQERVNEVNLKDKIIFTGFVDWTKLYTYYSLADIFVTVSLSEMHSMTILEALNLGVPVVCRRDTSFSDTVFPGKNGFFADRDEDMDQYLLNLIDDPVLASNMGKNALEISKNFTLESHGKRTLAFYQAVLDNFPNKVTSEQLQKAVDEALIK